MQGLRRSLRTLAAANGLRLLSGHAASHSTRMYSRELSSAAAISGRLEGKVAVITGAGDGIGKATAELFVQEGAKVVVADINEAAGQSVVAALGEGNAIFHHCNVAKEEDVKAAVGAAISTWGKIDIMHNNAASSGSRAKISELSVADLNACMAVNLGGVLAGVREAGNAMVAAGGGGCIINTGSAALVLGGSAPPAYCIAKAAVAHLTRDAAAEYGPHGIRVNTLSPSGVPTYVLLRAFQQAGFQGTTLDDLSAEFLKHDVFKGPPLSTSMVAQAALYLADDKSGGYISGHHLVLDGGYTTCKQPSAFFTSVPQIRRVAK